MGSLSLLQQIFVTQESNWGLLRCRWNLYQLSYQGSPSEYLKVKVKVALSCLTLCDSMDYTVHGILQARILEWVAIPFSGGISLIQGYNSGLLHYRQILYQLSHKGSPMLSESSANVSSHFISCDLQSLALNSCLLTVELVKE